MQARPFHFKLIETLGVAASILFFASLSRGNTLDAGVPHQTTRPLTPTPTSPAPATTPEQPSPPNDPAATRFVQSCAGCHTIGGGAARAPDLAGVIGWPESQRVTAIRTMQRKVGPLDDETIAALAQLLADTKARSRVEAAQASSRHASASKVLAADSRLGGSLFFGLTPLSNGGLPCNSCHRFHGQGGNLGPDLTHAAQGVDLESFAEAIARAGFAVMRGAYKDHPITEQEARHLSAFMQQATLPRRAPRDSRLTWSGVGLGVGAFLAAIVYVAVRPRGVRARLVQRATKR